MSASLHERYRSQLRLLADDRFVLGAIGERSPWVRSYARFEPSREPFAVLVFTDGECALRIDVFSAATGCAVRSDAGWLRRMCLDSDERLTTLPTVLRQPGKWRVQRYLPGRRCTLRLTEPDRGVRYAKVYADDRGARADTAGRLLWSAADLAFAVPRPDRWDAQTRTLWQAELPGASVRPELFGARGAVMAERIGRANASLSLSAVQPPRVFDSAAQMRQSIEVGSELAWRVPRLASPIRELLQALVGQLSAEPGMPRPIHGDPHAEQWLVLDDGRLGLLDFESVAVGDPELEAAILLTELEYEEARLMRMEHLQAAYVAGAASVGLELDARRFWFYRAHKRLAKALRSARAVRADGDERAELHVQQALDCACT